MKARIRPRLLPVVIAGGTGLLLLKVIGLSTQGGYFLSAEHHGDFGRSVTAARSNPHWAGGEDMTGATPAKKQADTAGPDKKTEPAQPLPNPAPTAAEREVLEQLSSRRRQLEDRAREMELREGLLKSAEKLAQDRLDELRKGEQRSDAEREKPANDLRSLVTIYETMKPRDAARIFDRMDPQRLAPLARQMQPKKLAEVISAMSPETAEKLTFLLMPAAGRSTAARIERGPEELQRLPRNPNVQ